MKPPDPHDLVTQLSRTLGEAAELLQPAMLPADSARGADADDATLLEQCLAMCQQVPPEQQEPIRTVHHFACTGGTLISKCIAALPNVQLLSEVDPLSTLHYNPSQPEFRPTDMIRLMRQSTRGTRTELLIELFQAQIRPIFEDARSVGLRLVLRDHAHSHFCSGTSVQDRPNLVQLLPADMPVLSLLTVRHPLDSFGALLRHGWAHFQPFELQEYCLRYLSFLDSYPSTPIVRYEDFTAQPEHTMQRICSILGLQYAEQFQDLFSMFTLTGDSGRTGDTITPRDRMKSADALEAQANSSPAYAALISKLGYLR